MIKYLIIDDEHGAHDIIAEYCNLLPDFQLMKNCYDAIEALEYLHKHQVDLIFLDLNMPKLKGFEFLRTLNAPPKVIVTTAYKEYALEGYELSVVDYLLKPFGFERFLKAVNKAIDSKLEKSPPQRQVESNSKKNIFLRTAKKYIQIDLTAILYIEAAGNYVKIITEDDIVTVREKISDLLTTLNYPDLIQVHKSFAVAKSHVNTVEGNRIFIGEHVVPIGKMYKHVFVQSLNQP